MISVVIVGSGNVAFHLATAFLNSDNIKIKQLYSRNLEDTLFWKNKLPTTSNLTLLLPADVTIVAISDDSIAEVSKNIQNSFVVHTSGAKEINTLKNPTRKGVFYPLQSFSKEKKIDFSQVPFCIEATNTKDLELLMQLAKNLGTSSYKVDSSQRKYLHVAAVFVNNFTNHLYKIAFDICKEHKVSFQILQPLIEETALKIRALSPYKAQTGPAKRKDAKTLKNHVNLLNDYQKEIYLLLTESIQKNGEKL